MNQASTHDTSRRQMLIAAAASAAALAVARFAGGQNPQLQARPPMPDVPRAQRPLNVLILGGTGFLGPYQVQHARARGHKVTIANRGRTRPQMYEGEDIEHLELDRMEEPTALHKAVEEGRKWDVVIDNSGYIPFQVKAVAEVLKDAVRQYIFVSSISVYQPINQRGADESWPTLTASQEQIDAVRSMEQVMPLYGQLKYYCEEAAEKAMPGRTTAIRSGLIVGPGDNSDRFTYWPARVTMEDRCDGRMLVPGTREDPAEIQVIDARDLAAFIITAAEKNATGPFNLIDDTTHLTSVVDAAKEHTGARTEFVFMPFDFLVENGARFWSELPAVAPPMPGYEGFNSVSNRRAREAGLETRPIEETTRDTIDWWKKLSPERQARLEDEKLPLLKPEREKNLLEKWEQSRSE